MKLRTIAPIVITATLLSACGGGGSGSTSATDTPVTPAATNSLSGVASKGPLKFAMVSAYKIDDNGVVASTKFAEATTDDKGGYRLDVGSYTGPVQLIVSVTERTLTADEATGQDQQLPSDFKLRASLEVKATSDNSPQSASITAYTELATKIAEDSGGLSKALSKANIAAASNVVIGMIGVDPVATRPADYSSASSASAGDDAKKYALFNAAVSKLAAGTPTTTDRDTLECFEKAREDAGKRIKCAAEQIARSVTVTAGTGGAPATMVINPRLVGLNAALVAASKDDKNKTGRKVEDGDDDSKRLKGREDDATNDTAIPIPLVVTAEETSDIAKAKAFFSRVRSNAAALANAPLDTGLGDGVKAFGDSIRSESLAVASDTGDLLRLAKIASDLWDNYKSGATSDANSPNIVGFKGGCTVFQGDFPTRFGGAAGMTLPYTGGSTDASSAVNASWVGCSLNQGALPTTGQSPTQYRRTVLFNMSAVTAPGSIPYIAVTRKRYIDTTNANALSHQNMTPTLSGVVGYTVTNQQVSGVKFIGDLPAPVKADGKLLAARYPVNVEGGLTILASGAGKVSFASGSLSVVPVDASAASLTLDLSPGGVTELVVPDNSANPAQVADAKLNIAASIKTAQGELTGTLVADRFTADSFGKLQPGHAKFTGSIAAAGKSGTVATFFSGALEGTNGDMPMVSFDGTLTLPNRPVLTLSLSVSQTAAATGSTKAAYSLTGRYTQDTVTVQISGAKSATGDTLTLADSSGVSVSKGGSSAPINVLVSGRQTARVDQDRDRIIYGDGSFESFN